MKDQPVTPEAPKTRAVLDMLEEARIDALALGRKF